VPKELLEESLHQVPESVAALSPLADFSVEIHNSGGGDVQMMSPGVNWTIFRDIWSTPSCPLEI
jgi:hypothetical protein